MGDYKSYKNLAKPNSKKYNKYGEQGSTITYNEDGDEYTIDSDGAGPAEEITFGNPDFNYKSVIGNAVLRWEVLPGSVFYLVWSHDKVNENNPGNFAFGRDFNNLWKSEANNAFLAKFSYWLDM